ncbi:MAG: hypothetical protein E7481_01155 [Ruminococcaceae bacterium]|nr:hypothetical protein [Oscillospiraceae bacterium]
MKSVLKLSLSLLLRTVLVCMLSFMAVITLGMIASSNGEINPVVAVIFGLIYLFMLLYFFTYTSWVEGGRDNNRVAIGQATEMLYKGYLSAAIVVIPIIAIFVISYVFMDVQNSVMGVLNILKLIFVWAGIYLTVPLTGGISTTTVDTEGADPTLALYMTLILCAVYIIAAVCSGVGYVFGYKKISFIPKLTDKIMGKNPSEKK